MVLKMRKMMERFDFKSFFASKWARVCGVFFCLLFLRFPILSFISSYARRNKIKMHENDFALFCKWDCGHYTQLAKEFSFGSAFFPLFPNIAHALSLLGIGTQTSLVISSFIFSLIASWLGLVFIDTCFKGDGGKSLFLGYSYKAWIFVIFLMTYPRAHVLMMGYAEPLFLCLLFLSLILWHKNKIFGAAILMGLLAVTRAQGVWLAAVFGIYWFYTDIQKRHNKLSFKKLFPMFFLVSSPFLIMMAGQWYLKGTPFYFLSAQKDWGRKFDALFAITNHFPISIDMDYFFLILSLYVGFYFWKKGDKTHRLLALFTIVMAEVPVFFGGFQSYSRFMLVNIGLFVFLSHIALKRPYLIMFYLVWGLSGLVKQSWYWVAGYWANGN